MAITPNEDSVQKIRDFFTSKFTAPSAPNQVAEDVWKALEGPIFKQNIFASSFLGIIDHSNMSYRYLSPKALDFFGIEKEHGLCTIRPSLNLLKKIKAASTNFLLFRATHFLR